MRSFGCSLVLFLSSSIPSKQVEALAFSSGGVTSRPYVANFVTPFSRRRKCPQTSSLFSTSVARPDVTTKEHRSESKGFIEEELRGAAMRLHTKSQAPKEGEAKEPAPPAQPRIPTLDDYLQFLVDSQHVYQAFEDAVNSDLHTELEVFRNTGLERTKPLENDIRFLVKEYDLTRPSVGQAGEEYATSIRRMILDGEGTVPEFICHYYNFYFAHTAGGRMIGKKMAALLLDKLTLDFYKWDDLNKIKSTVKADIEALAASWSETERKQCVDATAAAFGGGGKLNKYILSGGH